MLLPGFPLALAFLVVLATAIILPTPLPPAPVLPDGSISSDLSASPLAPPETDDSDVGATYDHDYARNWRIGQAAMWDLNDPFVNDLLTTLQPGYIPGFFPGYYVEEEDFASIHHESVAINETVAVVHKTLRNVDARTALITKAVLGVIREIYFGGLVYGLLGLDSIFKAADRTKASQKNAPRAFVNPVLPGGHPDPSCVTRGETTYCVSASGLAFPGLPIFASEDLTTWRLVSHAWNSEGQLPNISWSTPDVPGAGLVAPTLRYHEDQFWLVAQYNGLSEGPLGLVFRTMDPYNDISWTDPTRFTPHPNTADFDIFFYEDKVYITSAATDYSAILQQELDIFSEPYALSQPPVVLWTGKYSSPRRPHLFARDLHTYLVATEGTGFDSGMIVAHSSQGAAGPYIGLDSNPLITNRGTNGYFQKIGGVDIFHGPGDHLWGVAEAVRCGPREEGGLHKHHPMGKEMVLFPVLFRDHTYPLVPDIRGVMDRAPPMDRHPDRYYVEALKTDFDYPPKQGGGGTKWMPPENRQPRGDGILALAEDRYDFNAGQPIPQNLRYWRVPRPGAITIFDEPTETNSAHHPAADGGLRIIPSRASLSVNQSSPDDVCSTGRCGLSFIGRQQTFTFFNFTVEAHVDGIPDPSLEYGITMFLDPSNHIDLTIIGNGLYGCLGKCARLSVQGEREGLPAPDDAILLLPDDWQNPITLEVQALNPTVYSFSAYHSGSNITSIYMGIVSSRYVTGESDGAMVGVFASCNGAGEGVHCPEGGSPVFRRWRYDATEQLTALAPRERPEGDVFRIDSVRNKFLAQVEKEKKANQKEENDRKMNGEDVAKSQRVNMDDVLKRVKSRLESKNPGLKNKPGLDIDINNSKDQTSEDKESSSDRAPMDKPDKETCLKCLEEGMHDPSTMFPAPLSPT